MKRKIAFNPMLVDLLLLAALEMFMMAYLDIRYLFLDTIATGGDTASWHGMADHLLNVLLPHGRLTGWDWGNFCGYPNFTFYFLPPFLLAVLPALLLSVPLAISLKVTLVLGMFLLPLLTYLSLRAMDYRFPVPVIGASGAMVFLFNESYTIFGGNALSTLTGEFCYMLAFAVFVYFIGSLYKGITTEEGAVKNGLLLGFIGLCHLFVFLPAASLLVYWLVEKGRLRYLLKVGFTAFGLMAFWILPLAAFRDPYTTPVYMIWQPFVSWRYTFMGTFLLLLFMGPSLLTASLGQEETAHSRKHGWDGAVLAFSGLLTFSVVYIALTYLILGPGLWDTGVSLTPLAASPLGADWAFRLGPIPVPGALAGAAAVGGLGLTAKRFDRFRAFTGVMLWITLFLILFLASLAFFVLVGSDPALKGFFLRKRTLVFVASALSLGIVLFLRRVPGILRAPNKTETLRLRMLLALAFACVVGYFSAHFLEVPDIRFLPPLLFVAMLMLFADFLGSLIPPGSERAKVGWAVTASYLSILVIIFSAQKADLWFRYNAKGYESMPGFQEFKRLNDYLRGAREDPLNAPRVAYEKSNLYGRYGGDRVFESLSFFSGRQTLEGIHYASSVASRFTAFLQTAYSRDIKTPRSYILSKIDSRVLPAYFDLYNVSHVIVISDTAKEALRSSPRFQKEEDFGPLSLFRYDGSGGYVDVPPVRPVLYQGDPWVDDFVEWYKDGRFLDVLLVPQSYVTDPADRSLFAHLTAGTKDLEAFRKDVLDRRDLEIEAGLEPFRIAFTTNKIGLPHLVKASYFPNWKATGAHGVYPVSPHLMMVIPRQERVILSYGWTFWDRLGLGITVGSLAFLLTVKIMGVVKRKEREDPEGGERAHGKGLRVFLALSVLLLCWALIVGGAVLRNIPVRTYVNGHKAYQRGNEFMELGRQERAHAAFRSAIRVMEPMVRDRRLYDHQDVMNCILFSAMSHERLGQWGEAEALYRIILDDYPYSRYVAEAHVKLGRARTQGRNETLEKALELLQKGEQDRGDPLLSQALHHSLESAEHYERARNAEPYSVWARYALEDLAQEQAYFEKMAPRIRPFAPDGKPDLQEVLEALARNGTSKPQAASP
jgi:hypothetical protein